MEKLRISTFNFYKNNVEMIKLIRKELSGVHVLYKKKSTRRAEGINSVYVNNEENA